VTARELVRREALTRKRLDMPVLRYAVGRRDKDTEETAVAAWHNGAWVMIAGRAETAPHEWLSVGNLEIYGKPVVGHWEEYRPLYLETDVEKYSASLVKWLRIELKRELADKAVEEDNG
jgi:hypothetical protein